MKIQTPPDEQIARLISELKIGRPVIIGSEVSSSLVFAVETIKKSYLKKIIEFSSDDKHLVITSRRAEILNATPYDGDIARIILPTEIKLNWLLATANPALDLDHPMKGPFETMRGGDINISKASILLCKKSQLLPAALIMSINREQLTELKAQGLLQHNHKDILSLGNKEISLAEVSTSVLPLKGLGSSRIHIFRDKTGLSEHYAIEVGTPAEKDQILVRIHSACFTGDVIGSLKCDCGSQLQAAIELMAKFKSGLLIYLNQEGRGIGLANKMRAYELQNQGFDTVEANHRLGFEDEERDLRVGAQIIKQLGFKRVKLLTNNPKKIDSVANLGIEVKEIINLVTEPTKENINYLLTKATKSGHLF